MESELSVRDVLTREYVGASESDTVQGAVRLMLEERSGCVLVLRGSEPVGIVTEWDVLGVVDDERDSGETTLGEVMSEPVITVEPTRSLADAATTMARENIRNLVVTVDGDVQGVLTQRDVIAAAGSFSGTTSAQFGDEPMGSPAAEESNPDLLTNGGDEYGQPDEYATGNPSDEYSTQSICEACGSLADSLHDVNGQLVCSDCRSV